MWAGPLEEQPEILTEQPSLQSTLDFFIDPHPLLLSPTVHPYLNR